ncbi:hypothetical protein AB0F81_10625 [Actinoplanes sp. NPDC024001]|uniref:hypothetical protein n=1 Tax=Actinoplanes sp. NPDC024001 TaxID=3154598 RepID=UPI0033D76B59
MGTTRPEREEPLARAAYVAAARRFVQAVSALLARGVPIDPGAPGQVRDWTAADVAVLQELYGSLGEMIRARRFWDGLRR